MVNVHTTDQNARMERLDKISNIVGSYLLRGYKMLAEECATCGTVLLEDRRKQTYCVGCEEVDRVPDNEHPVARPATLIADVPAGMSREDLYSMLAQQNTENTLRRQSETVVEELRTPSPAPDFVPSATGALMPLQPLPAHHMVNDAITRAITALCGAICDADHTHLSQATDVKAYADAIATLKQALD